ncbi:MAG: sulfite exporter TauE/SafE family protein [Deltaproteobacteria bacterium]|nr:sulfite exporter TauE/SafE family protein [Deltaproteobacteria bacterium]
MNVTLPIASYWQKVLHPELARLTEPLQGWFFTIQSNGDLAVSLPALVLVGLTVGLLTGFFGVGGGFLMTPWLNVFFNVPYNVAVGTDLTQMVGTATMANLRQGGAGYVDFKLGFLLFGGSIFGVEIGARLVELLKAGGGFVVGGLRITVLQTVMTLVYGLLMGWIASLVFKEARAALRKEHQGATPVAMAAPVAGRLRTIHLRPLVSLPVSGVEAISLWVILGVGFFSGLLTGLLGVSGSFIRMPALIYVLGVPTVVSIGTNLFELLLTSLYGTLTHSVKGNVELVLVIILLAAGALGSQAGAALQRKFAHPRLQLAFAGVMFFTIGLMLLKLFR